MLQPSTSIKPPYRLQLGKCSPENPQNRKVMLFIQVAIHFGSEDLATHLHDIMPSLGHVSLAR